MSIYYIWSRRESLFLAIKCFIYLFTSCSTDLEQAMQEGQANAIGAPASQVGGLCIDFNKIPFPGKEPSGLLIDRQRDQQA